MVQIVRQKSGRDEPVADGTVREGLYPTYSVDSAAVEFGHAMRYQSDVTSRTARAQKTMGGLSYDRLGETREVPRRSALDHCTAAVGDTAESSGWTIQNYFRLGLELSTYPIDYDEFLFGHKENAPLQSHREGDH